MIENRIYELYENVESRVRSYCRDFPIEMDRAQGSIVFDSRGKEYIDFLMGCGSLNYGHNDSDIQQALIEYIVRNGITTSMDFYSSAKSDFLSDFYNFILRPRNLDYRIQFCGPTGSNAVEAAIKLSKKVTGRRSIISFTNSFHGCTLGALSVSGSQHYRRSYQSDFSDVIRMPYDGYKEIDESAFFSFLSASGKDSSHV